MHLIGLRLTTSHILLPFVKSVTCSGHQLLSCCFSPQKTCLYLSGAKNRLLSVFDQALFTEEMTVRALRHLLKRKLPVAAAALNQLTVLEGGTTRSAGERVPMRN